MENNETKDTIQEETPVNEEVVEETVTEEVVEGKSAEELLNE